MGTVYRAYDPRIGRTVAIKVLPVDDPELRARFEREVRAAGTLNHQHIVSIYDYGEADDRPFIVMEYINGHSLAERLRDSLPLSWPEKIRLIQQLCAALDYAHAHGIVHRDIKPANLMIDERGDLKVVDFGIAKIGEERLTRSGNVLGTLMYMSPEQVNAAPIDRRSDIFSVGVVIYETLTSRPAFQADSSSKLIHAILYEQPEPLTHVLPDVDPRWDRIITKALQKDPGQRYQTLGQLAAEVARIGPISEPVPSSDAQTQLQGLDPTVPPAAPTIPAPEPPARSERRWAVPALFVALCLAVGGGIWLAVIALTQPATVIVTDRRDAVSASHSPSVAPPIVPSEPSRDSVSAIRPAEGSPSAKPSDGHALSTDARAPRAVESSPRRDPIDSSAPKVEQVTPPAKALTPFEQARALLASHPTREQKSTAAVLLQSACDAHETAACLQAGRLYHEDAALKNLPLAAQFFQRACDGGNAEGCNLLGVEYAQGVAVPKDDAKAADLYMRGCGGGMPFACTNLARAYQAGRGVSRDLAQARALFQKACDSGGLLACIDGGLLLMRGIGGPADARQAVANFQRACDAGAFVGCADLALAYMRGDGVPKDEVRAAELYQRACDAGGAPACSSLAGMYTTGRGVAKDLARAVALLERSCEGKFPDACQTLAQRYEQGDGVEQNPTRAAALQQRATQLRAASNTNSAAPVAR